MIRSKQREHIFKMLFQIEFNDEADMPEHLKYYFETLDNATEAEKVYIQNKYEAAARLVPEIDVLLNENTKGWKTSRMNKVDLTILRLAVYEMKWDEDIPEGVAINEAVELAKKFGGDDSPSFVNGVLGRLARREK
ncbi:transcription antitermination factor NusB [Clostridium sp. Marseille-P3244]|uniref:transcription antitermination factor NusB n=1 Tax=Clostridium sp. Marseille-P3244 TaxID=1871020 RepID=UPI000931BBFA|nr:transcription antitermination factor NusB [Clostridium sp. Marseille-P3244]